MVNLTLGSIEKNIRLGPFQHPNVDGDEIRAIEEVLRSDESVQAEIAKLELPSEDIVVYEPWIYGASSPNCASPILSKLMLL